MYDAALDFLVRKMDGRPTAEQEKNEDAVAFILSATTDMTKDDAIKLVNNGNNQGVIKLSDETRQQARDARGGAPTSDKEAAMVAWLVNSLEVS